MGKSKNKIIEWIADLGWVPKILFEWMPTACFAGPAPQVTEEACSLHELQRRGASIRGHIKSKIPHSNHGKLANWP